MSDQMISYVKEYNSRLKNIKCDGGYSLLCWSFYFVDIEIVKLLVELGAKFGN